MTLKESYYDLARNWTTLGNSMLGMEEIDNEMQELIGNCWMYEPRKRPSAQDILEIFQSRGLNKHQDEVWSYFLHRDNVVKTQNMAGKQLMMATEKLLRVQYTLHKASHLAALIYDTAHMVVYIKINENGFISTHGARMFLFLLFFI